MVERLVGREGQLLAKMRYKNHNSRRGPLIRIQGGTIRGSINLPAQSLYPTLPAVYATLRAAGLRKVIFYCGLYPSLSVSACGFYPLTRRKGRPPAAEAEPQPGWPTTSPVSETQPWKVSRLLGVSRGGRMPERNMSSGWTGTRPRYGPRPVRIAESEAL